MPITIEQMTAMATPFTTAVGVEYKLPRLSLRTRKPILEFMSKVQGIEEEKMEDAVVLIPLMDELVTMLMGWLGKLYPDLTREQVEEEWDITDIPQLMKIIAGNEKEVLAVIPPDSPEETPAEVSLTGEIFPARSARGSRRTG